MKILVVDDNPSNRRILESFLKRTQHIFIEAGSGSEAIELYKKEQPELILMDIMMPGMDGRECAGRIKKLHGEGYLPIIYVTALDAESALPDALAAGGDDYVTKPINFAVLDSKIKAHQRIRELHRELSEKNRILNIYNQNLEREQELMTHFFDNAVRQSYLDPSVIHYHISAASVFNGDLLLSARRPEGGLYVLVGDFTGHGLAASIGTLPVAQVFFSMTKQGVWIGEIAREINRSLRALLPRDMFLAMSLMELNSTGKLLTIWHGGIPTAYLRNPHTSELRKIESQHMPLGILSDAEFDPSTQTIQVDEGEQLYVCTDGMFETPCSVDNMFGVKCLPILLQTAEGDVFQTVLTEFKEIQGNLAQRDDITFVEIICRPVAPPDDPEVVVEHITHRAPPFEINTTLGPDEMRALNSVSQYIDIICAKQPLSSHKSIIHTILSELYSNALEHGILELDGEIKVDDAGFALYYEQMTKRLAILDKGEVVMTARYHPDPHGGNLEVTVKNSGKGFEFDKTKAEPAIGHGRGLLLLNALCERVTYSPDGKTVSIVYQLKSQAA